MTTQLRLIVVLSVADAVLSSLQTSKTALPSISITRHHKGDTFVAQDVECFDDLCLGISSGTASSTDPSGCNCQCMPNLPIYRDDLHICVDDIQECTLAPFLSGTTTQKVPYVFLPLKGQIVYPSAEIVVSEVASPICVVSGAQFLGRRGWVQLRNNTETDLPFRLFRDEGRTYLQWLGDGDLRLAMEGRLILVHLMCKDASEEEDHKILTPCIAFRVAGNPSAGVREMMFATDKSRESADRSLSVSEYIAIGVCILLLGLVYIASIFLYLYFRRKKKEKKKKIGDGAHLTVAEEGTFGIVKSNPLLQATRRHLAAVAGQDNGGYASDSGSCCSESDRCSDAVLPDDDTGHTNMEIAAMVHPCTFECHTSDSSLLNQDASNIEKLPEEDVSIVETLEGKEDRPETVRSMGTGNVRKKLYFNPAYFELDMLKAPPPAALEFLTKIREVIAIAKHKMSAKRFSPSLIGIPEEDNYSKGGKPNSAGGRSRPPSIISYAGSTDSKRNRKDPEIRETSFNMAASGGCCPSDTKQRIIRKWLEDVPFIKTQSKPEAESPIQPKKPPAPPQRKENKKPGKGPAPPRPPPPPPVVPEPKPAEPVKKEAPPPPPLPPASAPKPPTPEPVKTEEDENVPRVQGKDKVPPVVAKTLMDAVIQEMIVQRKTEKPPTPAGTVQSIIKTFKSNFDVVQAKNNRNEKFHNAENNIFEMDSLERKDKSDETKEIDSRIDVYADTVIPIDSVIQPTVEATKPKEDDHDYEVILLNPTESTDDKEIKIYNLPEIMSKNEGYSLVSEVYVNDGYSYSSDGSTQSNGKTEEKPGRLTIHVKDSPENYKNIPDETETFEPDTLDRKPSKFRYTKTVGNWDDSVAEQYSNQRFHEMDLDCQHNVSNNNENFIDSLERPRISLRTSGSFRRNSLERDVNELFKNLDQPLARNFGSLREIYEAKGKGQRRATSLVGSVASDNDCRSTLSWSEDRRNKLLHRGIILHVSDEYRKPRRHKTKVNYPDVVPPRPPKPPSLTGTPSQRSNVSTPATRSYCPSPTSRSTCTSPPPRSDCTSPRPVTIQFPPPPPPPPPRATMTKTRPCPSPPRSGRNSPCFSGRSSPARIIPQPQPRSLTSSPTPTKTRVPPPPRITSMKPQLSPCPSPTRSPCRSPVPPPRPPSRTLNPSPPLPPRGAKPPLPPKNTKSTRQRKDPGRNLARRPLPPIPSPRHYQDSTMSSLSSRDLETLSTISGASIDSLNSSDYEAFYTLPYDGQDGEIFHKGQKRKMAATQKIVVSAGQSVPINVRRDEVSRGTRPESVKSWRGGQSYPSKLEDSGYLSTDSESGRRRSGAATSERMESQGSETEESLCDGASESGAESIATDSFFFGNFNRAKAGGSLDSGVGSEVNKTFGGHSFRIMNAEASPEGEGRSMFITVRQ